MCQEKIYAKASHDQCKQFHGVAMTAMAEEEEEEENMLAVQTEVYGRVQLTPRSMRQL